jgi:6-phosphogluconolactonase/glucosamine-6-phosphate isomerase/deaminase
MGGGEYNIDRLNDSNYTQWSMRVKGLLGTKKAWAAIDPGFNEPTAAQLEMDQLAISVLYLVVNDDTLNDIKLCTTAREIWLAIKNIHTKFDPWHGFHLLDDYVSMRKTDDETITQFLSRKSILYDKVEAAGCHLDERCQVGFIVTRLPKAYDNVGRGLRGGEDQNDPGDLTLAKLKSKLLTEERKINRKKENSSVEQAEASAFSARQKNSHLSNQLSKLKDRLRRHNIADDSDESDGDEWNEKQSKSKKEAVVTCFACGEEGHISPNCPSKSKSKKRGRKTAKEGESETRTRDHQPSSNPVYDLTPKDRRVSDSESEEDTDEAFTATATVRRDLSKNSWVLDSGATSHMCPNEDKFPSLIKSKFKSTKTAGKEILQTMGQGRIEIKVKRNLTSQRTITLNDVRYIPEIRENLISISKLATEGFKVEMDRRRVLIRERSGAIVAKGRLLNGLYILYEDDN